VRLTFQLADADDATSLAALHNAVGEHLTSLHGKGFWSTRKTEKGVLYDMRISRVFVARQSSALVGTLRLATKKPWAIDPAYFTPCRRPLYLLGMAVLPVKQRQGIGRFCLEQARQAAKDWPADAIRLDAFEGEFGAGGFYARCGYTEKGRVTYRKAPLIYYEMLLS
jgi:GNAT superfamily N-acetyltransferase